MTEAKARSSLGAEISFGPSAMHTYLVAARFVCMFLSPVFASIFSIHSVVSDGPRQRVHGRSVMASVIAKICG